MADKTNLYIVLVHHPVTNKQGEIVTTSVTNFDLHDLSRNGATYNVKKVFILTPIERQINMVRYIKKYWREGYGAEYNPDRKDAFEILEVVSNLEEAYLTIEKDSGKKPLLVSTTAKLTDKSVSYSFLQQKINDGQAVLLAFGTGFGLASEFLQKSDYILEPISGSGSYNHLPVRSAVAIILDRLVGR